MVKDNTDLHSRTSTTADGHTVITRRVEASTEAVWAVLAAGWMYSTWVVGASRIRAVQQHWPQPGSRIHHSFGVWPALIDDHTEVLECDPGRELLLKARGWPAGEAHVRIKVNIGSTPNRSIVTDLGQPTGGIGPSGSLTRGSDNSSAPLPRRGASPGSGSTLFTPSPPASVDLR
jgi:hypothetical protein